jgi:hypothetical protein
MKIIFLIIIDFLFYLGAPAQKNPMIEVCTVSPLANYNIKNPKPQDALKLVDGIYTKRNRSYFFESNTTLGWRKTSRVTINIALKQQCFISGISISTPSMRTSGIGLPLATALFVGEDSTSYTHVLNYGYPANKMTDRFGIADLNIGNFQVTGKYIKLVILFSSSYFLCDEITVKAIPLSNQPYKNPHQLNIQRVFTSGSIPSYIDSLKKTELFKVQLMPSINKALKEGAYDESIQRNLVSIRTKIKNAPFIDSAKFVSFKEDIQKGMITNKAGSIFLKEEDPFADTLVEVKPVSRTNDKLVLAARTFIGASTFKCIRIINENKNTRHIKIKISQAKGYKLSVFEAKFILARDLMVSPDALVPISSVENTFTMQPGENKLLFLKLTGIRDGTSEVKILVFGENKKETGEINIKYSVNNIDLKSLRLPYSVNWAYLNRPFYKGYENQAYNDLLDHHINMLVVPANMMYLRGGVYDGKKTAGYIKSYPGFDKYICFSLAAGLLKKIFNDTTKEISPDYLQMFSEWYETLLEELKPINISPEQILIYPLDEMRGKKQIDFFQTFQKWFHAKYNRKTMYATLNNMPSIDSCLKDEGNIYQVVYEIPFIEKTKDDRKNEKWIYDTRGPAKGLSPNSYYRLMPWKAFYFNFTGVGFWNYADLDHSPVNSEWDDFDGMTFDFNVVYRYHGIIIPSRRWEAFSLGLEDYALLRAYEKKYGREKALTYCNEVLNNKDNTILPEVIRNKILKSL